MYQMRFGKFKGWGITDIPTYYLKWCYAKCDSLTIEEKNLVKATLMGRGVPEIFQEHADYNKIREYLKPHFEDRDKEELLQAVYACIQAMLSHQSANWKEACLKQLGDQK